MEALKIPNLSIFVSVIDGLDTPINSSTAIGSPRGSIRWFENLPNNLDGRFGDGFFTDEKWKTTRYSNHHFFWKTHQTIFWGIKLLGHYFFPKHLRVCKLALRISIGCHTSFQGTKSAIATVEVHRKYVFLRYRCCCCATCQNKLPKWSFRARLPPNFHRRSLQNDRFVRGFLQISKNKLPKRTFRATPPTIFPKVGWWLRYGGDFSLVLVIFCKYKFLFLGGEIWKFPG